jgi:CheY-like chemotaxis protein
MEQVLLIADSDWVRNDVTAALDSSTLSVVGISDPHEAISAGATHNPTAYIVDMQVASMGGMATTRSLRSAMTAGQIEPSEIILLLDRSADEFLAKRSGASGWVIKPFTAQDLRGALSQPEPTGA